MDVALGLVQKGNEFLLIERVKQEENLTWAFPGGKREPDDINLRHTVFREVWQETGVLCEIVRKLGERNKNQYKIHYFLCKYLFDEFLDNSREVRQMGWYLKDGIYRRVTSDIFTPVKEYIDSI